MDGERRGGAAAVRARWLVVATMIAALLVGHVLSLHDGDGDHALLGQSTVTGAASPSATSVLADLAVDASALDDSAGSALARVFGAAANPTTVDADVLVAVACAIALILAGTALVAILVAILRRLLVLTWADATGLPPGLLFLRSGPRPNRLALGVLRV